MSKIIFNTHRKREEGSEGVRERERESGVFRDGHSLKGVKVTWGRDMPAWACRESNRSLGGPRGWNSCSIGMLPPKLGSCPLTDANVVATCQAAQKCSSNMLASGETCAAARCQSVIEAS